MSAVGETRVIRPVPAGPVARLGELWRYRWLLSWFSWQSIRGLYANTWLGWIWIPLRPAMNVLIRGVIFGTFLAVPSGGVPYLIFFAAGLALWEFFAQAWYIGTRSLELNRRYLKRIYIPRLIPLIASHARGFVWFAMYMVFFLIVVAYYWIADGVLYLKVGPNLLLAVAAFALLFLLSIAFSLFTSVYSLKARDPRFIVRYAMSVWFYLTPVIYPLAAVPADFRAIALANPPTAPMELFREGLLGVGSASRWRSGSLSALSWSCSRLGSGSSTQPRRACSTTSEVCR